MTLNRSNIGLTIVIGTFNNYNSLLLTISGIRDCETNGCRVQVIIVDNNSTDETKALECQKYNTADIQFICVKEFMQGLSYARNRGVSLSTSEYILFTDDDAVIHKNWIVDYLEVINKEAPDCLFSRIKVAWEGRGKPKWYIEEYAPFFVELDYGENLIRIDDFKHEFFGKNFCLKRSTLIELGMFDTSLGRCGDKLIAGEETLIYRKLIASSKKVIYFPSAQVGHRLKEREYDVKNIKKAIVDSAYTIHRLSVISPGKKLFQRPLYTLKLAIVTILKCSVLMPIYLLKSDINRSRYQLYMILRSLHLARLWVVRG